MIDKLDQPISLKTKDGKDFDVPADGSLGILAIGYKGIMLWRQKREAVAAQLKAEAGDKGSEDKAVNKEVADKGAAKKETGDKKPKK